MYKNYIFDFYGTLADIRTDESNSYLWKKMTELYAAFGAAYKDKELEQRLRVLEHEAVGENDYLEPNMTELFARLYEEKGVSCEEIQARMTAMIFRALSREYLRCYDGVKEFLQELRDRHKGVYLLSNAQSDFTRPEIAMLGLTKYFDEIFISSEQGVKKPSRQFFEKLLKTYHLNPTECIMIGNDESADIAGANMVGMDSLYIHTAISPQITGLEPATYRVMDGDFWKVRELILAHA
ncbi:MAG: HAD family hydrolase [Lachnospiraceae bacterium]